MGYHSEVVLALNKSASIAASDMLDYETHPNVRRAVGRLQSWGSHYRDPDTGAELYHWQNIKWYSDDPEYYPDIAFYDSLMRELPEGCFLFVRMGDALNDFEVQGTYWDNPFNIRILRGISLFSE